MDKVRAGTNLVTMFAEQADLIADAGITQISYSQASFNFFWEQQRAIIFALTLYGDSYYCIVLDVQSACTNKVFIGHSVDVRIVNHVVNVPVDVIIHPAGGDGQEMIVVGSGFLF